MVQQEGTRLVRREMKIYNLDMILAVGYRVTTPRAVQFRQWATSVLKEYLVKGLRSRTSGSRTEVVELNRLTTMFLDYAEDRARRRQPTLMGEWVAQADRFLAFNERQLLSGPGQVSASAAERVSAERYGELDERRRALEAEQSAADELQDMQELAEVERRRIETGESGDGH